MKTYIFIITMFLFNLKPSELKKSKNEIAASGNSLSKELKGILKLQSLLQSDLSALKNEVASFSEYVQEQHPLDCSGAKQLGDWRKINKIKPPGLKAILVQCDQFTDGGGWTVLVHRTSSFGEKEMRVHDAPESRAEEPPDLDFNRTWDEYKKGFGLAHQEYWIGNEALHSLTKERPWEAAVILEDWNSIKGYALWKRFRVKSEHHKYSLEISGYDEVKSSLGDGLSYHSGSAFSTKDSDNDNYSIHCARKYGGGWWFNKCHVSHLTGSHLRPGSQGQRAVHWLPWKGSSEALRRATLMIRPPKPSQL